MKLTETSIPQDYSKRIMKEKNIEISGDDVDKIAYTLFVGVATCLHYRKNKDIPVVYEIYNQDKNRFIAAGIVQFIPAIEDKPGHWNLCFTFNQSDIPEKSIKINFTDTNSLVYFRYVAGQKYGMRFKNELCMILTMTYLLEQIKIWLSSNIGNAKDLDVEIEGVFKAIVSIERNNKVFALQPAAEVKMIIKDDASIEV